MGEWRGAGPPKRNEAIRTTDWLAGAHVGGYSVVIDVRTPAEWEEDHVPGSVNMPVLSHEQRHDVGLLHKQSAFEGRKLGAALISRNIADIVEREFMDKPRDYRPLVYCWRGGQRSGSLATVLAAIGFRVSVLEGGYKGYRTQVGAALATLPWNFEWRVLTGPTGSGKTRLLAHFAARGEQTLDLEGLANHRGSVLGARPGGQPAQKLFESRVAATLAAFSPSRPVWVEDEASLVGNLHVPPAVFEAMKTAMRHSIELPLDVRVRFTLAEYSDLTQQPAHLKALLDKLVKHQGHKVVLGWHELVDAGDYASLVRSLLELHYDPANARSIRERRAKYSPEVVTLPPSALDDDSLARELPAALFAPTPGGPRVPDRAAAAAPPRPCDEGCRCAKCRRREREAAGAAEAAWADGAAARSEACGVSSA